MATAFADSYAGLPREMLSNEGNGSGRQPSDGPRQHSGDRSPLELLPRLEKLTTQLADAPLDCESQ